MKHEYVFVRSDNSVGMQQKSAPFNDWDKEHNTKVVGELIWECQTGKCQNFYMCLQCICYSGQQYNDFFGFGTYVPPWSEVEDESSS